MTARSTGKGATKAAPAKDSKASKGSASPKKATAGKAPGASGSKGAAGSKVAASSKAGPGSKPSAARPAPKPSAAKAGAHKVASTKKPEARKAAPTSAKAPKAKTSAAPPKPSARKGGAAAASKAGAGTKKAAPPPKAEGTRKAGATAATKPAPPKPRAGHPEDGKHPAPAKPKAAAAAAAVVAAPAKPPQEAKRARPEASKTAATKTPPAPPATKTPPAPAPKAAEPAQAGKRPGAKTEAVPPPAPPAPAAPVEAAPPAPAPRPHAPTPHRPGTPFLRPGEEPPPPPKRYPPPRPPRKLDLTRPKAVPEPPEKTDLPYPVLRRGKVREVYQIDRTNLLIVTSDRVSAFDVVMKEPIPRKGEVLTQLTAWWLARLETKGVEHHLISANPDQIVELHPDLAKTRKQWERRGMLVRKTDPVPVECVVRGYLAGSAWKDYEETRLLAGERLPEELLEGQRLPRPMWAPATKAVDGHDENITPLEVRMALGEQMASRLERLALRVYDHGRRACEGSGIILADTKYEFGLDLEGRLLLIDEVMTPDSSRFWPKQSYGPGKTQPSLDKQPIRDWLESQPEWDKKPPPPKLPANVVAATTERYLEIFRRLTGTTLDDFQPPLMRSTVP